MRGASADDEIEEMLYCKECRTHFLHREIGKSEKCLCKKDGNTYTKRNELDQMMIELKRDFPHLFRKDEK
jgi:hypothetical protein